MVALGKLTDDTWRAHWVGRRSLWSGPMPQIDTALRWLGIDWSSPTSWVYNQRTFVFRLTEEERNLHGASVQSFMRKGAAARILHNARDFLRFVLVSAEALRRPKDFGGLERGIDTLRDARESMHAIMLHFAGPAWASAGIWTQLAISRIPFHQMCHICCRCRQVAETTMHRLWECTDNKPFRDILDDVVPGNHFPNTIPSCLARCGLIPQNVVSQYHLNPDQVHAIQDYLLAVNASATQAVADFRSGKPLRLLPDVPRKLDVAGIYDVALPPLKKRKVSPTSDAAGESLPVHTAPSLPRQPDASVWVSPRKSAYIWISPGKSA